MNNRIRTMIALIGLGALISGAQVGAYYGFTDYGTQPGVQYDQPIIEPAGPEPYYDLDEQTFSPYRQDAMTEDDFGTGSYEARQQGYSPLQGVPRASMPIRQNYGATYRHGFPQ